MLDQKEVEYIDLSRKRRRAFWQIAIVSICIMAIVSLLMTFVYLTTVGKLVPYENAKENKYHPPEGINSCNDEKGCVRNFLEANPGLDCSTYSGSKDICYSVLAEVKQDITYCNQIESQVDRDYCLSRNAPLGEEGL